MPMGMGYGDDRNMMKKEKMNMGKSMMMKGGMPYDSHGNRPAAKMGMGTNGMKTARTEMDFMSSNIGMTSGMYY